MNTKKLIFILVGIFIVFLFYFFGVFSWYWKSSNIENFKGGSESEIGSGGSSGIREEDVDIFVNQEDFERNVHRSQYFHKLNLWDLRVRGIRDQESYKKKYIGSRMELTKKQKDEIRSLIQYVDGDDGLGMASSVLGKVPWKIAVCDGKVEGGLCHTIGDMIVFPIEYFDYGEKRKINLLIHEKTHVLQRLNPEWAESVIHEMGFSRIGKQDDGSLGWMEELRRHNPDLNSYDYGLGENSIGSISKGGRIVELFVDVSSLLDSATFLVKRREDGDMKYVVLSNEDLGVPSYVGQIEHPYEIMACIIPELVMKRQELGNGKIENAIWGSLWFDDK